MAFPIMKVVQAETPRILRIRVFQYTATFKYLIIIIINFILSFPVQAPITWISSISRVVSPCWRSTRYKKHLIESK